MHSVEVWHPWRRISASRRHSSQTSFPGSGDTCSEQKQARVLFISARTFLPGEHSSQSRLTPNAVPKFPNNN